MTLFLEEVKNNNEYLDVEKTVHELDDFIMAKKIKDWDKKKPQREIKLGLMEILRRNNVYDDRVYDSTMEYFRLCYTWEGEIDVDNNVFIE